MRKFAHQHHFVLEGAQQLRGVDPIHRLEMLNSYQLVSVPAHEDLTVTPRADLRSNNHVIEVDRPLHAEGRAETCRFRCSAVLIRVAIREDLHSVQRVPRALDYGVDVRLWQLMMIALQGWRCTATCSGVSVEQAVGQRCSCSERSTVLVVDTNL
jgi:hypothetical protein